MFPRTVTVSRTSRSRVLHHTCPASKSCRYQGTLPCIETLPLPQIRPREVKENGGSPKDAANSRPNSALLRFCAVRSALGVTQS
eukprot:5872313-Pyramimonas_sp.AAC.1